MVHYNHPKVKRPGNLDRVRPPTYFFFWVSDIAGRAARARLVRDLDTSGLSPNDDSQKQTKGSGYYQAKVSTPSHRFDNGHNYEFATRPCPKVSRRRSFIRTGAPRDGS